jgi:predicted ArsR family transcriptional regulator
VTFIIKELKQIKLLSDPLKLQLIQSFAEGDKTTRQVATELGENVTKLYRHVDALFEAGLLEITDETQKRGTVERTFRAVAQRFEADPALFAEQQITTR